MKRLALAGTMMTLLLAACAGGAGDGEETDAVATDAGRRDLRTPDVTMPDSGGTNGGVSQERLEDLLEQASTETGVPADEITVVTAESVTWRDGSLGCPQPGMVYTQALVPGYRVVLNVAGEEIHYHAAQDGDFFVCENPQAPTDNR